MKAYSGFLPARMTGRLASGAEAGGGKLVHLAPDIALPDWSESACGRHPGRLSGGWQPVEGPPALRVTCPTCRRRAGLEPIRTGPAPDLELDLGRVREIAVDAARRDRRLGRVVALAERGFWLPEYRRTYEVELVRLESLEGAP